MKTKITTSPASSGSHGTIFHRAGTRLRAEVIRCYPGQWIVTFAAHCGGRYWETLWTGGHTDGREYHSRAECIKIARAGLSGKPVPLTRVAAGEIYLHPYLES